jgi:hypothetical protein
MAELGPNQVVGPYHPDVLAALAESAGRLRQGAAEELPWVQASGARLSPYESVHGTTLAHRFATPVEQTEVLMHGRPREAATRLLYAGSGPAQPRLPFLDLPGGTETIERILADPRVLPPAGTQLMDPHHVAAVEALIRREHVPVDAPGWPPCSASLAAPWTPSPRPPGARRRPASSSSTRWRSPPPAPP